MTQESRDLHARAEQAREGLRQLLAQSMHDLSQPLTAMLGALELALMQPASLEKCRRSMEQALEYGEQLARMVRMLREFAEAERTHATLERVAISSLVKEVAEDFRLLAEDRGISFLVSGDEDLHVLAHAGRLRTILTGLLDLAIMSAAARASVRVLLVREGSCIKLMLRAAPLSAPPGPAASTDSTLRAAATPLKEHRLRIALARLAVLGFAGTFEDQSSAEQGISLRIHLPIGPE